MIIVLIPPRGLRGRWSVPLLVDIRVVVPGEPLVASRGVSSRVGRQVHARNIYDFDFGARGAGEPHLNRGIATPHVLIVPPDTTPGPERPIDGSDILRGAGGEQEIAVGVAAKGAGGLRGSGHQRVTTGL